MNQQKSIQSIAALVLGSPNPSQHSNWGAVVFAGSPGESSAPLTTADTGNMVEDGFKYEQYEPDDEECARVKQIPVIINKRKTMYKPVNMTQNKQNIKTIKR